MNPDLLMIAVLAGVANWAFRVLPMRFNPSDGQPDSLLSRLLAATGPAAICTLFAASVLPALMALPKDAGGLVAGLVAVVATFAATRSVAGATFAGAIAYGAGFWALA
jgi:Branched-chain amino acid transport protein (AzlD)